MSNKLINHPIFKELALNKNDNIDLENITIGSGKKLWWVCEKGHIWEASVEKRVVGRGCPFCKNKKVCKDNCLAILHPHLIKEWHPNNEKTPYDFVATSNTKVKWICEKDHEWSARISDRTAKKTGCRFCAGKEVCKDNCLATLHPHLIKEWHPDNEKTPYDFTSKSNQKIKWICEKGHEWVASICHRTAGTGCRFCAGKEICDENCLAILYPNLIKEWHPDNKISPYDITYGSDKLIKWICEKGHEWMAVAYKRTTGKRGCPGCSGNKVYKDNCLATLRPNLINEWHPDNEKTPYDFTSGSNQKVKWICEKNHEWVASIANRTAGMGCPYCSGKKVCKDNCLAILYPDLIQEWHPTKNKNITPYDFSFGSRKKVWWKCRNEHEWETSINHRVNGTGCPKCSKIISNKSQIWLDSLGIENREVVILANNHRYIVDGFDPETNTVYEFYGDFWHGNLNIFNKNEINKVSNLTFEELYIKTKNREKDIKLEGYKLITIWESDFDQKEI